MGWLCSSLNLMTNSPSAFLDDSFSSAGHPERQVLIKLGSLTRTPRQFTGALSIVDVSVMFALVVDKSELVIFREVFCRICDLLVFC